MLTLPPVRSALRIACVLVLTIACAAVATAGEIAIPDATLEAALRAALGLETGPITEADLASLSGLYSDGNLLEESEKIAELQGLQYATNLETLTLTNHAISDINALYQATKMTELKLSGNRIVEIGVLAAIPPVPLLDLSYNHVESISGIYGYSDALYIDLRNNYLDLASSMTSLTINHLTNDGVTVSYSGQLIDDTVATPLTTGFDDFGGAGSIEVTSSTYWSASSSVGWITIDPGSESGFGNSSISFSVAAATGDESPRVGLITVNGQTILFTQGPLSEIEMADAVLESAVREALGIPSDPITDVAMLHLTSLLVETPTDADDAEKVASLAGLEHASKLTDLSLTGSLVTDLDPIRSLPLLKSLFLNSSRVEDAGDLSALQSLERLTLIDSPLAAIPDLPVSAPLTSASFSSTMISDLSPLATATQLIDLYIPNTRVADLSPLQSLTSVQELYLDSNHISQIAALADLPNLQSVYIRYNYLSFPEGSANAATIATLTERGVTVHADYQNLDDTLPTADVLDSDQLGASGSVNVSSSTYWSAISSVDWIIIGANASDRFRDGSFSYTILGTTELTDTRSGFISVNGRDIEITQSFVTPISFPDPALEAAIREQLKLPTALLTSDVMRQLTSLEVEAPAETSESAKITSLSGLENATNLQALSLPGNAIADLLPLAPLTQLTFLNLAGNDIANLEPLEQLASITELHLQMNLVREVHSLTSLSNLQKLHLNDNHLLDMSPLGDLPNLQVLYIQNNYIPFATSSEQSEILQQLLDRGIDFGAVTAQKSPVPTLALADIPVQGAGEALSVRIVSDTYWTASSSADWIDLAETMGFGESDLGFSVGANDSLDPRAAVLSVSGATATVQQAGLQPDATLERPSADIQHTAGQITVPVSATTKWRASTSDSWLQAPSEIFHGDHTISVSISPNYSNASRVGFIDLGSASFTITQGYDSDYFQYLVGLNKDSTDAANWPNADADRDGISNRFEYATGFSPFDANSRYAFEIRRSTPEGEANILVTTPNDAGLSYPVEYSFNLSDWLPFEADAVEEDAGFLLLRDELAEEATRTPRFYRQNLTLE